VECKQRITTKVPRSFFSLKNEEEKMITRFHGVDRHKKYSTIAVLNCKGEEVDFKPRCIDLKAYR